MKQKKELLEVQFITGKTCTYEPKDRKRVMEAVKIDILHYAKQYHTMSEPFDVVSIDDEEYFVVDRARETICSPSVFITPILVDEDDD